MLLQTLGNSQSIPSASKTCRPPAQAARFGGSPRGVCRISAAPSSVGVEFGRARHVATCALGQPEVAVALSDRQAAPQGTVPPERTVVVGGGPCGLATAMMLSERGWRNIEVWERLAAPPPSHALEWGTAERSYNLGVNEGGQRVLKRLGVYDRVRECSAELAGRCLWSPQKPDGDRSVNPVPVGSVFTRALPRDRLQACLLEGVQQDHAHAITVHFERSVAEMRLTSDGRVALLPNPSAGDAGAEEVIADFVVGADGAGSTVRSTLVDLAPSVNANWLVEKRKNTRIYKSLVLPIPDGPDWPKDATYSERSKSGRVLECLPTVEGKLIGLVIVPIDDKQMEVITTADQARTFLEAEFPHLFPLMSEEQITGFASKQWARLPVFQYVGPDLHLDERVVLLGDCIHTVKPYFGLGVNAALEDVRALSDALDASQGDLKQGLAMFSKKHFVDSRALVEMSHIADQGLIFFVLPLIVDSFFHKLAPWLFDPAAIRGMQRPLKTWGQVQRRKRLDRVLQMAIVAAVFASIFTLLRKVTVFMIARMCSLQF